MFTLKSCEVQKKHKKCKWMTSALLKLINTKNQLCKDWIKADINNVDLYYWRKDEFKSYYNTLRRSIREAKRLYHTRTYIRTISSKPGLLSKIL